MSVTVKNKAELERILQECLNSAMSEDLLDLPIEIRDNLNSIFENIDIATSGYLNLLTCLVCSSVDDSIDPRYHRRPGKGMPAPEVPDGWFSGRTVSEKIIYPWMEAHGFRTAKSGWQTRTFERPNPYTLAYPENIAFIKEPFLKILDFASKNKSKSALLVTYLLKKEIAYKTKKQILTSNVSKNRIGNEVLITDIISSLQEQFSLPNSSHLPVIAVYSIYELLFGEIEKYRGLALRKLESHQASDLRTGAVGDIEIEDSDGDVIEGVEVKHGIEIDITILLRVKEKILKSQVKRYYILTTHNNCSNLSNDITTCIRQIYHDHGCQIIINGVLPTIKYYLRMCTNPSVFINHYSKNISDQKHVTVEQLENWEKIQDSLNT
ncbi:hypothetical protein VB712_03015 [Spirulina sp. CCNP1310]|uniref:hypothetical protein n=1 Tax=Spirulina sp. CCNP1310 TaxID=3110249 RepID=UPI002B1F9B79|nr:hypothetical protein [Spirulina sp. CCNP1310]MEA5418179.1 hypothetical protein [Spirulina sp. CCNP1310]